MSKTSQQKQSAWDKGYRDGLNGNGYRWKRRLYKSQYDEGLQIGKMDRRRNALTPEQRYEEDERARARHRELGPVPV